MLQKFCPIFALENKLRAELITELIALALKQANVAGSVHKILHLFSMRPRADHAQIHLV